MDMAERFSETSEAVRLKVAAFLIKDGNIVSHAINGTPSGWPTNVCEYKVYQIDEGGFNSSQYPFEDEIGPYKLVTKDIVIHAEEQCLQKMWNSHEVTAGSEMLCTHACCLPCSIKIKTAGITKFYYRYKYRSEDGLEYLKQNGVEVEQI